MATLTNSTVPCIRCGHDECHVIDSRMREVEGVNGMQARARRRRCTKCYKTFATYELRASDLGALNAEYNRLLQTVQAMHKVFSSAAEVEGAEERAEYKDYKK